MINQLVINKSMSNIYTVDEFMVIEPEPKRCLYILNAHFSHCSIEFFQFVKDYTINLIYFLSHAVHLLQTLDVRIFEFSAKAYCLKLN